MIFVNFKTFEKGTGANALSLVRVIEEVSSQTGVKIIPVVQTLDLKEVTSSTKLEVWVQKVDPVSFGANTGSILPEAVYEDGAAGTFLNHSENKVADFGILKETHERAREVNLKTLIFVKDLDELKKVCLLLPNFVAYEPPELIGNTQVSATSAKRETIAEAVVISKNEGVPLIVGAGIHSHEDVRKSLELGAVGVAVATDVAAAIDPKKELLDLAEGFTA